MTLSLEQRLDRLRVRIGELAPWRVIEERTIEGWTFEGDPIGLGARWPNSKVSFAWWSKRRRPRIGRSKIFA